MLAIGNIGSRFIMFLLLPLYTHVLSTPEYGITELVLVTCNLLIPIFSLSIGESVLRYGLNKNYKSGIILKNSLVVLISGSIIMLSVVPILQKIKSISEFILYIYLIAAIKSFRSVFSLYLKSVEKIRLYAIDNILYALMMAIFNIILLVIYKMQLQGFFLAIIFSTLFSLIFILIKGNIIADIALNKADYEILRQMILFSAPMIINAIVLWINSSSDRIMLGIFLSSAAVGIYSVSAKIPTLITTITNIFIQAWVISSVTEYDSNSDKGFYQKVFHFFNLMLVSLASVIISIIKCFMQFYVGDDFIEAWVYVPILLLASLFLTYSSFFGAIYIACKKTKNIMITTLIGAIFNIILNFILIKKLGILGAILATLLTFMYMALYRMYDSRKYISFYIDHKVVFLSIIVLFIQCYITITQDYPSTFSILYLFIIMLINKKYLLEVINFLKAYRRDGINTKTQ